MQCISLHQPFATLLVSGAKAIETRDWPIRHRGPLLVHAAKRWDADAAWLAVNEPFRPALERAGVVFTANELDARKGWNLPLGAVVGRVDVVDCVAGGRVGLAAPGSSPDMPPLCVTLGDGKRVYRVGANEWAFGSFGPGRYAWVCANPVRFAEPVPYRGERGLFAVEDGLIPEAYRCR